MTKKPLSEQENPAPAVQPAPANAPATLLRGRRTFPCTRCGVMHDYGTPCQCAACGSSNVGPTGEGISGDYNMTGRGYEAVDVEEMRCQVCGHEWWY